MVTEITRSYFIIVLLGRNIRRNTWIDSGAEERPENYTFDFNRTIHFDNSFNTTGSPLRLVFLKEGCVRVHLMTKFQVKNMD